MLFLNKLLIYTSLVLETNRLFAAMKYTLCERYPQVETFSCMNCSRGWFCVFCIDDLWWFRMKFQFTNQKIILLTVSHLLFQFQQQAKEGLWCLGCQGGGFDRKLTSKILDWSNRRIEMNRIEKTRNRNFCCLMTFPERFPLTVSSQNGIIIHLKYILNTL